MNIKRTIALPLAALAVIGAGLTLGATLPSPAPAPSAPLATTSAYCAEDDPCFNCETMGDYICGDVPVGIDTTWRDQAWAAFDEAQARRLKVDGTRPFRIDLVGYSIRPPKLGLDRIDQLAVEKDGRWFIFKATYTDGV